MKKAQLIRTSDDGVETIGSLIVYDENENKIFSCDTLEKPFLGNQHKISCIPIGNYTCKWGFMNDQQTHHYEITNVIDRQGIFVHAGNYVTDSLGCVLLGKGYGDINSDGVKDLLSSKNTINAFETLLGQEDFTLDISNAVSA